MMDLLALSRKSLLPLAMSTIAVASALAQIPFEDFTISTDAFGANSIFAADLDGDGDLDALSASWNDHKVAWYENDGSLPPIWTAHTISTSAQNAYGVYAADVDGDGDLDVLSASYQDRKIAWYENDGAQPPQWTSHVISTTVDGASSVSAADIDADGDMDVLSASTGKDEIAWFENDGARPPAWTFHSVSTSADEAYWVSAADVDGDGDLDLVSASGDDDKIAWYESNGARPPSWTPHVISTQADEARAIDVSDVDGDGDLDVLSASLADNKIAWYESDGARPPAWTEHVISTEAKGAYSVVSVDLDGDGDLDVVSASERDDKIAWYENDGASPPRWTTRILSKSSNSPQEVFVGDVDGDGDPDVLSASWNDRRIAWYRNQAAYLVPSSDRVSISSGGLITFRIDMPERAAGDLYLIAISTQGTGPMRLGGLTTPMTFSKVVVQSLQGRFPSYAQGFMGTLNSVGDGQAYFAVGAGQLRAKWAGRTIHFIAVCRPIWGTWRYTSHAAALNLDP